MKNKHTSLDDKTIKSVLDGAERRIHTPWSEFPDVKGVLVKAIKARAKMVWIRDKVYDLTYDDKRKTVHFVPRGNEMVPRGYLPYRYADTADV